MDLSRRANANIMAFVFFADVRFLYKERGILRHRIDYAASPRIFPVFIVHSSLRVQGPAFFLAGFFMPISYIS